MTKYICREMGGPGASTDFEVEADTPLEAAEIYTASAYYCMSDVDLDALANVLVRLPGQDPSVDGIEFQVEVTP